VIRLYRFDYSPFVRKVQMVLDLIGTEYEAVDVPYGDRTELAELTGGYIQVPVLVADGEVVTDSRGNRRGRMTQCSVFVTGGTGYLGRPLIRELIARGHRVRALVRAVSAAKLPERAESVIGDALGDFAASVSPSDTLVHLVGTPHPGPHKAREFREVDLVSIHASVAAAKRAAVRHLVYVSVAHPAPAMRAYIAAREEGEALITASGLPATILRPWYVLGPGHRWPCVFLPLYRLAEALPWTRDAALRLGLVSLSQMVAALVLAVENPAAGVRFAGIPEIREAGRGMRLDQS
jgi:uncharacterized protein YbjT (DUF2867 family)/glutaredoxin